MTRHSAADDFDTIRSRRAEITARDDLNRARQCAIRAGIPPAHCWCQGQGENGQALPCPPVEGA